MVEWTQTTLEENVHIRKARPADWKTCLNLDHSASTDYSWRMEEREHEGIIDVSFQPIHLPRQVQLSYPREGEALAAGWESCDLFLVASEGKICAYLAARSLPGHGLAWIQDLVVAPERRRQGLGSQLMHEAAAWAVDRQLQRLVVELPTRNYPGVCFCRALGFSFCGYHDHHWRNRDIALLFGLNLR